MKLFAADASMELFFSASGQKYYYALRSSDSRGPFYSQNLPDDHIFPMEHDEVGPDPFWNSVRFTEQIKEKDIDAFWPFTTPNTELLEWGRAHGIRILADEALFSPNFENKLVFDEFLRKREIPVPMGGMIRSMDDLRKHRNYPAVLQSPESHGAQGTFMVDDPATAEAVMRSQELPFPLLLREFLPGIPLGATILIGKESFILSALRLQLVNKNLHGYMGIQWCPSSCFSESATRSINEVLIRLGKALQKTGFRGVANVDLLLVGDKPYVLECNPRTSLSSPQMCYHPELFHGLDFVEERLRAITGMELSRHNPYLPQTMYGGTTLDLDYFGIPFEGQRLLRQNETGTYISKEGRLEFESHALQSFLGPEKIFICNGLPQSDIIGPKSDFGFLMTNTPFFSVEPDIQPLEHSGAFFNELTNLIRSMTE